MTVFVALLRGINVGGHHKLPMKTLREIIEGAGGEAVSTYIQSGNAVFQAASANAATLEKKLGAAIEKEAGFRPDVFLIGLPEYRAVLNKNPFAASCGDPSKLFVVFLKTAATKKALADVESALVKSERIAAKGKAVYFDAPEGVGRSKAAEKLGKAMPGGTMRNWRSCVKLEEMASALT